MLNAVLFPAASFQSSACRVNGDQVDVSGVLTVHGVGADVTVTMDIEADAKRFRGMGTLAVQHADFGMTPYSAPLGVLRNQAELVFHLDIVARSIDP